MSSQSVPIHRANTDANSSKKKDDTWFNPFDFAAGQDANIRWLSRPNLQATQGKYSRDAEKFRITFDAENFKPEQIKLYIQNRRLTISGVYEERHEGSFTQKQFERTFDIPANADVNAMASFITANHMLVVEIPLGATSTQVDHLNIDAPASNQRRLSFSLDKFNSSNNANTLSTTSNDLTAPPNQSVRRSSITKTTTTTTTTGSSGLSPEVAELLKNAETKTTSTTVNQPQSSTTINKQTLLTSPDFGNLPIDIPPELLASGGTITIQKRRVSVSKTGEAPADHNTSSSSSSTTTTNTSSQSGNIPINRGSNTNESTTTTSTTSTNQSGNVPIQRTSNTNESTTSTTNTSQTGNVPIQRTSNANESTTSTTNTSQTGNVPIQRTSNTNESTTSTTSTSQSGNVPINRGNTNTQSSSSNTSSSTTSSHDTPSKMYTLEEFLQNKTWNPSLSDGANGKKILHMRLQMKSGVTADQVKISLNGYDLRVEVDSKTSSQDGRKMSEHSYRQVTLFPTCEIEQLKTELKNDGYLHIQVPITL